MSDKTIYFCYRYTQTRHKPSNNDKISLTTHSRRPNNRAPTKTHPRAVGCIHPNLLYNSEMNKVIFIFLDGVGIGKSDASNPFYRAQTRYLPFYDSGCLLPGDIPVKAIDACMGIPGMPMSATGQTSLFTGTNVPALLGQHRDSYPDRAMRQIIKQHNIFSAVRSLGRKPRFINAFPGPHHLFSPMYIHIKDDGELYTSPTFQSQVRRPLSATTCMMVADRMLPFGREDIRKGRAIFHDYSNETLDGKYPVLPRYTPEQAAEIIYSTSRDYDLLLYEYFQTDFYGHGFEPDDCVGLVKELDRLTGHLISLLDPASDTLIITSDHGNIEDFNTQLHTYNPVPLLTYGFKNEQLRERISNLAQVKAGILDLFTS